MSFVDPAFDWYSAWVNAVIYTIISYHSWPRYNSTWLYNTNDYVQKDQHLIISLKVILGYNICQEKSRSTLVLSLAVNMDQIPLGPNYGGFFFLKNTSNRHQITESHISRQSDKSNRSKNADHGLCPHMDGHDTGQMDKWTDTPTNSGEVYLKKVIGKNWSPAPYLFTCWVGQMPMLLICLVLPVTFTYCCGPKNLTGYP